MKSRILTEAEQKECCEMYNNGYSVTKLWKHFNTSPYYITNLLKNNGIEIVNRQNQLNFDIEKDIIPLIEKGYTLTDISKIVHNSRQTLAFNLKKCGYEVINRATETKFNENVFDCIDTEEKAYWLGFMYADGCIYTHIENKRSGYPIELCLSIHDINHLYKFSKFLGFKKDRVSVGKSKCGDKIFYRCRCVFANKHLWNVLNNYGCTPNKSLTLKFPDPNIFQGNQEILIKHFIRGYIDGDGSISYTFYKNKKGKKKYWATSSVLGTIDFLDEMCKYLNINNKHFHPNTKKCGCKTYVVNFFQEETQKIIHELYENSTVYLERKYKRAMFFKDTCRSSEELEELLRGEIEEQTQILGEHRDNQMDYE